MEVNYFKNAGFIVEFSFYFLGGLIVLAGAMKIYKIINNTGDI